MWKNGNDEYHIEILGQSQMIQPQQGNVKEGKSPLYFPLPPSNHPDPLLAGVAAVLS